MPDWIHQIAHLVFTSSDSLQWNPWSCPNTCREQGLCPVIVLFWLVGLFLRLCFNQDVLHHLPLLGSRRDCIQVNPRLLEVKRERASNSLQGLRDLCLCGGVVDSSRTPRFELVARIDVLTMVETCEVFKAHSARRNVGPLHQYAQSEGIVLFERVRDGHTIPHGGVPVA
jgi:hypothetical protein